MPVQLTPSPSLSTPSLSTPSTLHRPLPILFSSPFFPYLHFFCVVYTFCGHPLFTLLSPFAFLAFFTDIPSRSSRPGNINHSLPAQYYYVLRIIC